MNNKYTFWIFLFFLISFIAWWYFYAFTTLNKADEDSPDVVQEGENTPVPEEEIKNPEPREVGEALTDVITYTLNAASLEHWVYFDFSIGSIVEVANPSSLDWDIGFRRALIITNSGKSNQSGMGGVAKLENTEFESVKEAPESGYVLDVRRGPTETENPAMKKWYDYSYMTHVLKPKKNVYIIRTADGKYAKMQILKYTCGRLTACYTIKYVYQGNGSRRFY